MRILMLLSNRTVKVHCVFQKERGHIYIHIYTYRMQRTGELSWQSISHGEHILGFTVLILLGWW